jgi:hypothetical protein
MGMSTIKNINVERVSALPDPLAADTLYFVKADGDSTGTIHLTNNDGTIVAAAMSGGGGGAVDSVNSQTGTVVLDADDIDDASTTHKFASVDQLDKVDYLTVTGAVDLDQMEDDIGNAVSASSAFGTDNVIVRSDGTGRGSQASGVTIDDSDNLKTTGTMSVGTTTNPYQLTVRKDQVGLTQFGVGNYTSGGSAGFRLDAFGGHYIINQLYGTGTFYFYTNATMIIGTYAAKDVRFLSDTTERARLHSTGEWSIGTVTKSAMLSVNGAARVGQYTVATVPSASTNGAGSIIYVSDEVGGACLAFSDGTDWKRVHDPLTTIS